jgi:hypothetical protein
MIWSYGSRMLSARRRIHMSRSWGSRKMPGRVRGARTPFKVTTSEVAAVRGSRACDGLVRSCGAGGSGVLPRPDDGGLMGPGEGRRSRLGDWWGRHGGAGSRCGDVEVAQRLGVGAGQAGLAVGQAFVLAEGSDQGLAPAQVGPGHGGKQVVLDLVVQAAQGQVGQLAAADVAGGQHLAAQEVTVAGRAQDGHALVVGGKRAAQVQAEQALLHHDERHRLDR